MREFKQEMSELLGLFGGDWATLLFFAGVLFLCVDIVAFELKTYVLTIVGVSMIVLAGLIKIGVITLLNPDTAINSIRMALAFIVVVITMLLWEPLKRFHRLTKQEIKETKLIEVKDLNGCVRLVPESFEIKSGLSEPHHVVTKFYAGVVWRIRSQDPVEAGEWVKVTRTSPGTLFVEPANK